ncbi:B-cell receptor CD22-like [Oryzias latipes]
MDGGFKAGDFCNYSEVKIQDSPQRPSIEIPDDPKEGASVSITCSAPTPCLHSPPKLTWNLQPDFQRQTEKNTDGSFTTKIQKIITLSDTHDGLIINCSARYPVNGGPPKTAETHKTLSVSYAPKKTSASISPSGLVSAGSWVTMTCSSRAKPAVSNFIWFRSSKDGDVKVAEGESYSLNATEGGGVYYCVATNDLGNQTSPKIDLTVGENLNFIYILSGAAAGILLLLLIVFIGCFRKNKQQQQVSKESTLNGGPPKTAETHKTLSVSYAPKKTSASISPSGLMSAGSRVTMTCSSRAKPAVSNFIWFRSSKDGDVKVAEGESYSLNATEGGGVYYCVATNDLGNQTSPKIDLIVEGKWKILMI